MDLYKSNTSDVIQMKELLIEMIENKNQFADNQHNICRKFETDQRFPRKSCSLSMASNKALKLPFPNDLAPFL